MQAAGIGDDQGGLKAGGDEVQVLICLSVPTAEGEWVGEGNCGVYGGGSLVMGAGDGLLCWLFSD